VLDVAGMTSLYVCSLCFNRALGSGVWELGLRPKAACCSSSKFRLVCDQPESAECMYFVILDSVLIHTVLTICANERYVLFVHIAPGFYFLLEGNNFYTYTIRLGSGLVGICKYIIGSCYLQTGR